MNINKLNSLVVASKLNKAQIAESCGISRTTLDNVLAGADAKISTIESLARVLKVSVGELFSDSCVSTTDESNNDAIICYQEEIKRLQTLLNKQSKSTKVVVELDIDNDEFVKLGLKDKVVQVLSK